MMREKMLFSFVSKVPRKCYASLKYQYFFNISKKWEKNIGNPFCHWELHRHKEFFFHPIMAVSGRLIFLFYGLLLVGLINVYVFWVWEEPEKLQKKQTPLRHVASCPVRAQQSNSQPFGSMAAVWSCDLYVHRGNTRRNIEEPCYPHTPHPPSVGIERVTFGFQPTHPLSLCLMCIFIKSFSVD